MKMTSALSHNDISEKWNKLAPYDQVMNDTQPRYIQMLFQQLQKRQMIMMKVDGIEWKEFSEHSTSNL
jgi:hypothetical protein